MKLKNKILSVFTTLLLSCQYSPVHAQIVDNTLNPVGVELTLCESIAEFIEGVFSSYSAMLTYLRDTYSFESKVFKTDGGGGKFKDTCDLGYGVVVWDLSYEAFDLIGETSHKTDKLLVK